MKFKRKRLVENGKAYLRWFSDEICHSMDDDSGKACGRDPVESGGQAIQGNNDNNGGNYASCWCANTRFGFQGGTREGAGGGICTKARANGVSNSNGDQLLVRIDLISIQTPKS